MDCTRYTGSSPSVASSKFEGTNQLEVFSRFDQFYQKGIFCDVTIVVGRRRFVAHRLILSAASRFFETLFTGSFPEANQDVISLDGPEASIFYVLLRYAYTNEIILTAANVLAILSAADILQMVVLKEKGLKFLRDSMDPINLIGAYQLGIVNLCPDLQAKAKSFMLENFSNLSHQEMFMNFLSGQLIDLLSDEDLVANSEDEVWDVVERWYKFKPEERLDVFPEVLKHVRLSLMSLPHLTDRVESLDVVKNNANCMSLVSKAKAYISNHRSLRSKEDPQAKIRPRLFQECIVILGGMYSEFRTYGHFLCFSDGEWKTLKEFPHPISGHAMVATDYNMLYVAGGLIGGLSSKKLWCYDPEFDDWEELAPMSIARSGHCLAELDKHLYAVGGFDGRYSMDIVEKYDPVQNAWLKVASLKIPVAAASVAVFKGKLYVAGGLINHEACEYVQCYDPTVGTWTCVASLNYPRLNAAMCSLGSYMYLAGGSCSSKKLPCVEYYDGEHDIWVVYWSMNERREYHGSTVHNGKFYVLGGCESRSIEVFDPATKKWTEDGKMPEDIILFGCASLRIKKTYLKKREA